MTLLALLLARLLTGCAPSDADGDGFPAPVDCDDADAAVFPGAPEVCDAVDDDCDGRVDDADPDRVGGTAWPLDADGDGWGDAAYTLTACVAPAGFAAVDGDCDDHLAGVHPDADELCGGGDEDCDGVVDEPDAADAAAWYDDADGDGAGDPATETWACTGHVAVAGDCDDDDAATAPGVPEVCDGLDQDCDGLVDDADADLSDGGPWYPDRDGDGWGASEGAVLACAPPAGHTADGTDCDDSDATAHPGAAERCDRVDQDCDTRVDEADGLDGGPTWYVDGDGDGYGTSALSTVACTAPAGFVAAPNDCDDADGTVYPSADETCDGVDDDCDGAVDEGALDASTWYADTDGDGYGDALHARAACAAPADTVADASDCDDSDATVLPGATEACDDGVDQDCDGFERPCPLAASVRLGDVGDQWNGETADDRAGHAVAWAGDTDGDGLAEGLVTAYREDSVAARAGAVYLVNTWGVGSAASLTSAAAKLTGTYAGDHAGNAVTGLGDVDGDGFDDLLVGAYLAAPSFAGAAYLVSGPVSSGALDAQTATFAGENADDQAGAGVGRAGDVDGDGLADVVVGAPNLDGAEENIGGAYLFYGPVSGTLSVAAADVRVFGEGHHDQSGHRVTGGDLDGDGLSDLVVGALGASEGGAVFVFAGPLAAGDHLLSDADASAVGTDTGDQLGWGVSTGDSDDDGYADLLCGAPAQSEAANDAGAAYLFRGPLVGDLPAADADARLLGESTADEAGYAVNLHGDFDGDGRADALIGAWAEDETATTAGATYVELGPFSGVASLGDVYAKLVSNSGGTESGRAVDGGGDIDGDGLTDILVGAPDISASARGGGGAYVLLASEL